MIETFFFVPLANKRFLRKVPEFQVDNLVYDLEDAVKEANLRCAFENISDIIIRQNDFVRIRIRNHKNEDQVLLNKLVKAGFRSFVIPKIRGIESLSHITASLEEICDSFSLILLIENPEILFGLPKILETYSRRIIGIGLGSHDYCNEMNAKHEYDSYRFAHDYILNLAYMHNIKAIDVASMDINAEVIFKEEAKRAFNKGYRAKFILHPKQLDYLYQIDYFSQSEIEFAKKVFTLVDLKHDFNAVKIDGQILEAPHIKRIKQILKYINYESK